MDFEKSEGDTSHRLKVRSSYTLGQKEKKKKQKLTFCGLYHMLKTICMLDWTCSEPPE